MKKFIVYPLSMILFLSLVFATPHSFAQTTKSVKVSVCGKVPPHRLVTIKNGNGEIVDQKMSDSNGNYSLIVPLSSNPFPWVVGVNGCDQQALVHESDIQPGPCAPGTSAHVYINICPPTNPHPRGEVK